MNGCIHIAVGLVTVAITAAHFARHFLNPASCTNVAAIAENPLSPNVPTFVPNPVSSKHLPSTDPWVRALAFALLLVVAAEARPQMVTSTPDSARLGLARSGLPRLRPGIVTSTTDSARLPSVHSLPTSVPPIIDGRLDDACWTNAPIIDQFTQVEPVEGAAPSERTEVRMLHDHDYLFIAIHCFDREPAKIVAKQMQRDADMDSDDTLALVFDTFARKRTGYLFKITPRGATQDALLEADGAQKTEWDTIWNGRSRIDETGWTAEIAIPFKSLAFDPQLNVWGFNVERVIRRRQETVRWAAPFQNKNVTSLADLGELRDLSGMQKGLGLEFKPFLVARHTERTTGESKTLKFEAGFDLFYSITPALTAALTVNTDFAEAEVDKRQVNLTRFPLFFPEKRDFFLQDANLFSFGAYKGPLAFNSRRIGLGPTGETVDLLAGGKLTGRIGNLDIGLLDVQVDSSEGVPSKNLAVARASYRVLEESSIGGIFTSGDPQSSGNNSLVGTDLNYRNSHFFGNNVFKAQTWVMKASASGAEGRQMAFGASVRYPNEPVAAEVFASQIDADFNPALGFAPRRGIRQYGGKLGYRWRPGGYVRSIGLQVQPYYATNLDGVIETESVTLPAVDFLNEAGDSLNLGFSMNRENFREGFEISPGVFVPGGDYRFNRAFALLSSTSARPLSAFASVDVGEFYDGHSREYGAGLEWRVNAHVYLRTEGTLSQIDLPAGSFDVVVGLARLNFAFTPNLSWNTVVQYDNVSNTLGVNSRLKWIVQPGSQIFLVFNYGFDAEDGRFRTLSTDITTKVVWTFRF